MRKRAGVEPAALPTEKRTITSTQEATDIEQGFPIVGIGASAGGLAAFEAFFTAMPEGASRPSVCRRDHGAGDWPGGKTMIKKVTHPGGETAIPASPKQVLRERAEEIAREKAVQQQENRGALSPGHAQELLHELRVHQIELEIQNEELRRTQEELEASRARYFDLYDQAPVGYVTLSNEGLILEANRTAGTQLGVTLNVLVGKSFTHFILPEDQDIFYRYRKAIIETGAQQRCEVRMARQDGGPFWAQLETTLTQDDAGITLCRVVISDVSERNRAEEDAKRSEVLLRQSQKMEAVGRLAAGVAHELNNPLSVILGFAEAAVRRMVSEDPLDLPLKSIMREALRCKNLVQKLLIFSRAQKPQPKQENLAPVVESGLDLVEAQARIKHVEVVRQFSEAPLPVLVDNQEIQQVIINLCANAIDAMPSGGKLTVALLQGTRENGGESMAEIRVTDTGSGIPAEIRERIFEPFFTTKAIGKGTGLGLSLAYEIVQRHHGDLSVESQEGQGTTFRVLLPLA